MEHLYKTASMTFLYNLKICICMCLHMPADKRVAEGTNFPFIFVSTLAAEIRKRSPHYICYNIFAEFWNMGDQESEL
jgi:hypothetical protein